MAKLLGHHGLTAASVTASMLADAVAKQILSVVAVAVDNEDGTATVTVTVESLAPENPPIVPVSARLTEGAADGFAADDGSLLHEVSAGEHLVVLTDAYGLAGFLVTDADGTYSMDISVCGDTQVVEVTITGNA